MKDEVFRMRCSHEEKLLFEAAAERAGKSLSEWALDVLVPAAGRVTSVPPRSEKPVPPPVASPPAARSALADVTKAPVRRQYSGPYSKAMQAGRKEKS